MEYKRPLKTKEAKRMMVPAAVTLEIPLMRIFMAAGSRTKLSVADHSTSAPVSKKKPNWTAAANHVVILKQHTFASQLFAMMIIVNIVGKDIRDESPQGKHRPSSSSLGRYEQNTRQYDNQEIVQNEGRRVEDKV